MHQLRRVFLIMIRTITATINLMWPTIPIHTVITVTFFFNFKNLTKITPIRLLHIWITLLQSRESAIRTLAWVICPKLDIQPKLLHNSRKTHNLCKWINPSHTMRKCMILLKHIATVHGVPYIHISQIWSQQIFIIILITTTRITTQWPWSSIRPQLLCCQVEWDTRRAVNRVGMSRVGRQVSPACITKTATVKTLLYASQLSHFSPSLF